MVRTEDGSQIIVTGTTFMVSFFPDQKITLVRVFNGELKFSNSQGNSITLRTNQWGIIEKGQSPIPSEDMKLLRDIARYLDVYNLYHEIELDVQKGFGPEGVALTPVQVEIVFQEELVLDGLLQNVDLTGLNLPGQPIQLAEANPQLCQEACASTPNCASFTYTSGGSCWLKSGVPRQISSLCCISGIVRQDIQPPVIKALKSEPSGPQVCIDQNPDVKFYSIMTDNSIVDTASLYYTFSPFADSNPSQGTQTMGLTNNQFLTSLSFSEGGNLEFEGQAVDPSNNTASTGKIQLTLWDCTGLEFNTDRMGLDISRDNVPFTTTDPQSCRQACQNDPDCMAFSYVEGNQLCWIKFGVPLPRKSMNIISGVVRPDQVPPLISEPVSSSSSSFGTGCHEGPATFITVDIFDKSNMNNALIQVRQGEGYGWITIPMWQISSAVEGNQVRYQYQVDVLGYVSYGWQYKILATDVYGNYRESIIYTIMQIIC
jgi:hypothetical protein